MTQRKKPHPDPVDVHAGQRVRLRRMMLGMSQEHLGDAIGVTFQQLQKYEKGDNRISASRLYGIAKELEVPIEYFFEELPPSKGKDDKNLQTIVDSLSSTEGLVLNKHFARIKDPVIKQRVVGLIKEIANMEDG